MLQYFKENVACTIKVTFDFKDDVYLTRNMFLCLLAKVTKNLQYF